MKTSLLHTSLRIAPFTLPLAILSPFLLEADILIDEGFETDGLGSRYFATDTFTDGSDDYFIRTDGTSGASGIPSYTDYSGSFFWAAEDTDASDNPSGLTYLDFAPVGLADITAIRISLEIAAGSQTVFDSIDDFVHVQYRVDSGSWQTVLSFQNDGSTYNSSLRQDTDLDGIGDGLVLDLSLQNFSTSDLPVSGATLDLRIDMVLNGGGEAVAFDSVRVTGVPEPAHFALVLGILTIILLLIRRRFLPEKEDTEPSRNTYPR
jgi:hypothetical protein